MVHDVRYAPYAESRFLLHLVVEVFPRHISACIAQPAAFFVIDFVHKVIAQYRRNSSISLTFTHGFQFLLLLLSLPTLPSHTYYKKHDTEMLKDIIAPAHLCHALCMQIRVGARICVGAFLYPLKPRKRAHIYCYPYASTSTLTQNEKTKNSYIILPSFL